MNVQAVVTAGGKDEGRAMSKTQSGVKSGRTNVPRGAGRNAQPKLFPVWTRYAIACVVAALIVCTGVSHRVLADGGALDPTFNGTGTITANFWNGPN